MRFVVDECTAPAVARWLRSQNHEVFSVYEEARGLDDDTLTHKAGEEEWILIANDKDFGQKVFREGPAHHGVILLRLQDERAPVKIECLRRLLQNYADRLQGQFVVVTETKVRFARR